MFCGLLCDYEYDEYETLVYPYILPVRLIYGRRAVSSLNTVPYRGDS